MVAIIALDKVGIIVTPFIAAIGALSLGAGLALQGLLSNYGAGFNIILTRPFIVGDTIRVQNVSGWEFLTTVIIKKRSQLLLKCWRKKSI